MAILSSKITTGMYLVELSGALTAEQATDLNQAFKDLAEKGAKRLVIDMAQVPFVDSRGLAALVSGYRIFGGAERDFRLAAIQDQPRLVFDLTGFNHVFHIYNSVAQAVAIDNEIAVTMPLPSAASTAAPV
jgi:anti-sigma B factor antagonist